MKIINNNKTQIDNMTQIKVLILATLGFTLSIIPSISSLAAVAFADLDVAPAPPSIGADIPLTYFGPAPSMVQRELIGPYQLLKSGQLDMNAGIITLPLYQGQVKMNGGSNITKK